MVLGISIGFAGDRLALPTVASAQGMMPTAAPMPMHHSGSMSAKDTMGSCPEMHTMIMHMSKSPADKALMKAMMGMHDGMMSMQLTGDADRDFMTMMIPHHQAAIDMATVELKSGKNLKVRALAKEIIAAQQKEIAEMQTWLHTKY
ncbi:MAG: DUF305 domain-containing protein [Candidatus Eremiobacteraeota bacterium]|nr:DUF305 domain-containing protein [Candidatus Eremiobacteraeota bacterium]